MMIMRTFLDAFICFKPPNEDKLKFYRNDDIVCFSD